MKNRLLAVAVFALALPLSAQIPALVRDLNIGPPTPNPESSHPSAFMRDGESLYFTAYTEETGSELWKYAGGIAQLVKDINPGQVYSSPARLVRVGSTLLFSASTGTNQQLWQTDGTEGGTALLKDINPDGSSYVVLFDVVGTRAVLQASDGVHGRELWVSDGTAAGTQMIADMTPGSASTSSHSVRKLGDRIYLATTTGFWVTDGTAAGTTKLASGASAIAGGFGSTMLFRSTDAQNGMELWKTDGTLAGTSLLKDIQPGTAGSHGTSWSISAAAGPSSVLFFANDGSGIDLWSSNGTAAGTQKVKTFAQFAWTTPPNIFYANGLWWIPTTAGIWRSDGTAAGTFQVTQERTISVSGAFSKGYFLSESGGLWSSDGTAAGTVLVKKLDPRDFPSSIAVLEGKLYFSASDGGSTGVEPWVSEDGTAAGTHMLANVNAEPPPTQVSSNPVKTIASGSHVYFIATADSAKPPQLWKSDGTFGGTVQVTAFDSATPPIENLTAWNGMAFFTHGRDLWRSGDAGTVKLTTLAVPNIRLIPARLSLLVATTSTSGGEMWRTDGTPGRTVRFTDATGASMTFRGGGFDIAGLVHFLAHTTGETALWTTEGVPSTTSVVIPDFGYDKGEIVAALGGIYFSCPSSPGLCRAAHNEQREIRIADLPGRPESWVSAGRYLYFRVSSRLWRTDGTAAGTIPLNIEARDLTAAGNFLFFTTVGDVWRSDGTPEGTVMLDINPRPGESFPGNFAAVDGYLWFSANDGLHGSELWRSDGTAEGTTMVADIAAGGSSLPGSFAALGRQLFFAAWTESSGRELWSMPLAGSAISAADARVTEGNSGSRNARFTITRAGSTAGVSTVSYKTFPLSATEGTDYTARSGVVTFTAGQTTQFVDVPVLGDTEAEHQDEAFALVLSSPTGAVVARGHATGVIDEDDVRADLSIIRMADGRFRITNAGPSPATGIELIVSASPAANWSCGNRCMVELPELLPGSTYDYIEDSNATYLRTRLSYDPAAPPLLTVTASVKAAEADPNPADNVAAHGVIEGLMMPPFLTAGITGSGIYYTPWNGDVSLTSSNPDVTFTPAAFSHPGMVEVPLSVLGTAAGSTVVTVSSPVRPAPARMYIVEPGATPKLDVAFYPYTRDTLPYGTPLNYKVEVVGVRHVDGARPTGTLQLFDGDTLIEEAALVDGAAKFVRADLLPRYYNWAFRYSGDANFHPSTVLSSETTEVTGVMTSVSVKWILSGCGTLDGTITVKNEGSPGGASPTGTIHVGTHLAELGTFPLVASGPGESRATARVTLPPGLHFLFSGYVPTGGFDDSSEGVNVNVPVCPVVLQARGSTTNVTLTWTAYLGPAPVVYDIYRATGNTTLQRIGEAASTQFVDTNVEPNRAYLYAVMARDGNGDYAPISNSDLATTIGFTDDPVLPKVTRIRALHFTELRNAINAVRALAGLQPYTYSSTPAIGALMRPEHIAEMRSALAPALTAMNLPQPTYTNTTVTPGILVKASHLQELRNIVK